MKKVREKRLTQRHRLSNGQHEPSVRGTEDTKGRERKEIRL